MPLQRLRNEALAYLMLKTGLREIEISRATVGDLQPAEPGQYWRLYVHGKGHLMADEWVKVLPGSAYEDQGVSEFSRWSAATECAALCDDGTGEK